MTEATRLLIVFGGAFFSGLGVLVIWIGIQMIEYAIGKP